MKILGKIFDLILGLLYSFFFTTVFIEREDLFNNWQWWVGGAFAIGVGYAFCKWNKDEIDTLKEEIDKLKEHMSGSKRIIVDLFGPTMITNTNITY